MTGAVTYAIDPFPGLRPFEPEHSALFFGREEQTDELLRRLERARFLAIVGDSGSGKSSLVRAGLIPALQRGYMAEAGSNWQIALFRPGDDPVGNLARALHRSGKASDSRPNALQLQKILQRNSMGLVQAACVILPSKSNLLVVVDQFEEIFRYKRETQKQDGGDSAAAFVKLLLNAAHEESSAVNVVLTMRSDFLGECSQFRGLPEALNGGQYLVPRLTREQMKEAIEGPAAVAGAEFTPMLVQRLLNDVGDSPDQLPVLQHALMRTWEESAASREREEPISLSHYESIGGITQALNRHVESAYRELSAEDREIAKRVFQRLTERDRGGYETRRPTKVSELCALTEEKEERVIEVVNKFREAGRTFLTSPDAESLNANSIIDITHESLIRLWDTLHEWVAEETDSAHVYRRLAESAEEGRAAYHDQDLKQALAWREETRPNQGWAERYHPAFPQAMEFLDRSWKLRRAANRRKTAAIAALIVTTVVAAAFALKTMVQDKELAARELLAEAQRLQGLSGPSLQTSALLAIESLRRSQLFESDLVLRRDIALLARPVATLQHEGSVQTLAFCPEGNLLATGTDDGAVRVFDAWSGEKITEIKGQTPVLSIVFSPDGRTLASGNFKGAALFDAATGKQLLTLNHDSPVYTIAFSPDGLRIAIGSGDGTARLVDVATGKQVWISNQGVIVNTLAFSPSGEEVATGSGDGTARILAAATGKQRALFQHTGEVRTISFSSDGLLLATGGAATTDVNGPGVARVFAVRTGNQTAEVFHHGIVNAIAFSPDGAKVATGSQDGAATVFAAQNGNEVSKFNHPVAVSAVAFSPDGRWVATASGDHTGRLFEAATGREVARLIHEDKVRAVAFSADGRLVATGSNDHTARVFVAGNGNAIARIPYDSQVLSAVFSPNGQLVATVGKDGVTHVVQQNSGKELTKLPRQAGVKAVVFSPDGRLLGLGTEDGQTLVFEATTGREVGKSDEVFAVAAIAFSADGAQVASTHADGLLQVFETAGGREILRLNLGSHTILPSDAIRAIKFSPDGTRIITGGDDATAHILDTTTGREIAHYEYLDMVRAVAVSPRGNLAAAASYDGTAVLVEVSTGREIERIRNLGQVNAVAFSHDGSLFAAASSVALADGSREGITRVFDTGSGKGLVSMPQSRPVQNVIFGPEDRRIAAVSEQEIIQVFHAIDARKLALITADQIKDVRFAEDGTAMHVISTETTGPDANVVSMERHLLQAQDLIKQGCSRLTRNLNVEEWKSFFKNQRYRWTCPDLP